MKRHGILNADLSYAIATMGHGDIMMIVDAGFPIPAKAWRIDLALVPGIIDLPTIYAAVAQDMFVEKVMFANEMAEHNKPLLASLRRWFDSRDFAPVNHEEILGSLAQRAKVVVRSGALDPWGNAALVAGIDAQAYFASPNVTAPPRYRDLIARAPFVPGQSDKPKA